MQILKITSSVPQDFSNFEEIIKKQLHDVIPDLLKAAMATLPTTGQGNPKETKEDKQLPVRHTLGVERMADGVSGDQKDLAPITDVDWIAMKRDVKRTLKKVPVKKASVSGGTAILNFASKAHLDEAKEALSLKYKVSSKSEDRKKLDPKLTIRDIPTDIMSKENLEEKLLEKNENMKSIKVVFFDDKQRYAVIQVSAETRESIRRNGDCVNIDLSEHYVTDRFHVIQCYHCQEFGHMANSRYCKDKDKDPTCFYCGGSHTSRDCMNKEDNKIKKKIGRAHV